MSLFDALRHRVRAWLRPETHERELREEMEFHLALDAMHQQEAAGDGARFAARRRFGNVTRYAEEAREMSGLGFFDMAKQDLRFALRTFRHAPGFTTVAALTIALGVGATAAIFSVVDAVILKPLPYPDAERIVMVWMDNRRLGVKEDVHSYPNLADLKAQNRTLSHLAPFTEPGFNVTSPGAEPQRVYAGAMPAEALDALGVRPMLGRLFTAENEKEGNDAVVVLGYGTYVVPLPEQVVGPTLRTALWIMLGAVAAVLLIACANVANLLLSRAAVREREVTVRMALGASTGRLVRQLLSESLVLSAIGGA